MKSILIGNRLELCEQIPRFKPPRQKRNETLQAELQQYNAVLIQSNATSEPKSALFQIIHRYIEDKFDDQVQETA